jgi:spermidine synthase
VQTTATPEPGLALPAWIIAFIEGFSTLAVEVIAIRLAIPVVGSSITLTGVMLGVVLFALSAGYWRGGALSARWDRSKTQIALARNLFIAAVLYGALAFPFEALLLEKLLDRRFPLPLAIGATAILLLLAPVYLASQTVPMLAELINTEGHAGKASGRVLFFSTLGSVAGGVVTPVWLFSSIGVTWSSHLVCGLLAAVALAMALRQIPMWRAAAYGCAALALVVASRAAVAPPDTLYSFDSAYQSIRIVEEPADNLRLARILLMSGGRSSGVYADDAETSFEYVLAAEKALGEVHPETVLVIGAAGFTFPRDAARLPTVRRVDAVDVDPVVLPVAEQHFLKQPLPENVRFLPLSARYAVRKLGKDGVRYGFTFVDAYFGRGIPDELVTLEFFSDLRPLSEHTAMNVIMDRDMDSAFAKNLLDTFRAAFGGVWVKDVKPGDSDLTNFLVTSWPVEGSKPWNGSGAVYHDDKSTADRDHVRMVWSDES